MYVDADGENPLLVLGLVIGAYIGGVATNRGEAKSVPLEL